MERSGNTLKCFTMIDRATWASAGAGADAQQTARDTLVCCGCPYSSTVLLYALLVTPRARILVACLLQHAAVCTRPDSAGWKPRVEDCCRVFQQQPLTSDCHHRLRAPEPLENLAVSLAPHLPGFEQEKVVGGCDFQGVPNQPRGGGAWDVPQLQACGREEAICDDLCCKGGTRYKGDDKAVWVWGCCC